jgi:hypothetical protein
MTEKSTSRPGYFEPPWSDSDYCSIEIKSQSRLEAAGALGRMLPALPPATPAGDLDRRYMDARVAIRTHATIWEIESTVKTADQIPLE